MALNKTHIITGVPISIWDVSHVSRFDPVKKEAVIAVNGYFDSAAQADGNHLVSHEFLIVNTRVQKQVTRGATLEEKKKLLPQDQIDGLADEDIKKINFDIVEAIEEISLPYFDDFAASFGKGKWKEGAIAYLKSGAAFIHGFFDGATDL